MSVERANAGVGGTGVPVDGADVDVFSAASQTSRILLNQLQDPVQVLFDK